MAAIYKDCKRIRCRGWAQNNWEPKPLRESERLLLLGDHPCNRPSLIRVELAEQSWGLHPWVIVTVSILSLGCCLSDSQDRPICLLPHVIVRGGTYSDPWQPLHNAPWKCRFPRRTASLCPVLSSMLHGTL